MSNFELSHSCESEVKTTKNSQNSPGQFFARFWGVRGLIPTPSSGNCRYGGNTACVEINVNGKYLIFDGGTGLRILGKNLDKQEKSIEAHLFFTNSQTNRIQGFPFFAPAFTPENCLYIYGTAASNGASIKHSLCDQMLQPLFPYPLQVMQSQLHFYNLNVGKAIALDDITVNTGLINRHQRSVGYKVSWKEYSIAYITDLNINVDRSEQEEIVRLTQGVDLLIANTTFSPPTELRKQDNYLYWHNAIDLAQQLQVKRLAISQHHPDDDDEYLNEAELKIKSVFTEAIIAREGSVVKVV
ncbi:MAG: MBL fold metallo-hydrolase [Cyanobacteria bacterium P01_A01_bin.84]